MSLSTIYSRATVGLEAPLVTVEVHISNGLPAFSIVGLPETAVRESRERVRSAIINSQFEFPTRRITVNLAPADLPKEGGRFDLAIALGILMASGQISPDKITQFEFIAELALNGQLRPVNGLIAAGLATLANNKALITESSSAQNADLIKDLEVYPAKSLLDVCAHLNSKQTLNPLKATRNQASPKTPSPNYRNMADIVGQSMAKHALLIAASGAHNLLLIGAPGCGKTMLAKRLPGILPPLSDKESLDVSLIHSLKAQDTANQALGTIPFRQPHHTASYASLVGGGAKALPGEISLAHHGVLFLDELTEFNNKSLEALREPLESASISIARANISVKYPANFLLIAAMNPCPCGYYGSPSQSCYCSPNQIKAYQHKISGPLLDRMDIRLGIPDVPLADLINNHSTTTPFDSNHYRQKVQLAREQQLKRQGCLNSQLTTPDTDKHCKLGALEQQFLLKALTLERGSARAYRRVLTMARTVADLDGSSEITKQHLAEAFQLRKGLSRAGH